jgi:hypothetical protein
MFFAVFSIGCGSKLPPVTNCVYHRESELGACTNPKGEEFKCALSKEAKKNFPDLEMCPDKMLMMPFSDFGTLLTYCKGLKK